MGEAKRRKVAGTETIQVSYGRRLVAAAATHFFNKFVQPIRFTGGCYYISTSLRYYLGTEHGLTVETIAGFSRPEKPGYRWNSHMWLEFEGQITDIAICMAEPPDFPGRMLVDGKEVGDGEKILYSKERPNDGVPVDVDMPGNVGKHARKEHEFFTNLSKGGA